MQKQDGEKKKEVRLLPQTKKKQQQMGDFIILLQKKTLNQASTIIKLGASLCRQWKRCQGEMHEWSDEKEKLHGRFLPPW